jgi:hypothetical protein
VDSEAVIEHQQIQRISNKTFFVMNTEKSIKLRKESNYKITFCSCNNALKRERGYRQSKTKDFNREVCKKTMNLYSGLFTDYFGEICDKQEYFL